MEEIRSKVSYDSTESNVDYIQRIKEAEDKLMKVQKQFSYFKFYSFVWFFSFVLFSFFALMLFTGIFNSIVAVTGLISSIVGGIGAYLDWRDRKRNYD